MFRIPFLDPSGFEAVNNLLVTPSGFGEAYAEPRPKLPKLTKLLSSSQGSPLVRV